MLEQEKDNDPIIPTADSTKKGDENGDEERDRADRMMKEAAEQEEALRLERERRAAKQHNNENEKK
jgi:hypothetical protein